MIGCARRPTTARLGPLKKGTGAEPNTVPNSEVTLPEVPAPSFQRAPRYGAPLRGLFGDRLLKAVLASGKTHSEDSSFDAFTGRSRRARRDYLNGNPT